MIRFLIPTQIGQNPLLIIHQKNFAETYYSKVQKVIISISLKYYITEKQQIIDRENQRMIEKMTKILTEKSTIGSKLL